MKHLTEEQTWAVVAQRYKPRAGLCFSLKQLADAGLIGKVQRRVMLRRMHRHRPHNTRGGMYWWPLQIYNDPTREDFATRMAVRAAPTVKAKQRKKK